MRRILAVALVVALVAPQLFAASPAPPTIAQVIATHRQLIATPERRRALDEAIRKMPLPVSAYVKDAKLAAAIEKNGMSWTIDRLLTRLEHGGATATLTTRDSGPSALDEARSAQCSWATVWCDCDVWNCPEGGQYDPCPDARLLLEADEDVMLACCALAYLDPAPCVAATANFLAARAFLSALGC